MEVYPMVKEKRENFTDYLYARPSFAEGIARLVDFSNILQEYNTSSSPGEADEKAIRADWLAVGYDMVEAIEIVVSGKNDNGQ
jgi:hypothetical protein